MAEQYIAHMDSHGAWHALVGSNGVARSIAMFVRESECRAYAAHLNACAAAQVDPARVGEELVGLLSLLEMVVHGRTLLDMSANTRKPREYAAAILSRLAPAPEREQNETDARNDRTDALYDAPAPAPQAEGGA